MSSASIKTQLAELANHIQTNHPDSQPLKILENIGDYSFVIKLNQFIDLNFTLTLQIPVDFNVKNLNICINATGNFPLQLDLQKNLHEGLVECLKNNDINNNVFIELFNETHQFAAENLAKTSQKSKIRPELKKKQHALDKSNDENKTTKKDDSPEKLCSMKTASDVLNRIIWDDEVDKSFVTVGYLDRFLGLKECAFNVFDWGDIVEADLGALAIPKHRINYFKYKNEIIWNKSNRLDNVFGSTGSNTTIYDIIRRLENEKFTPDESNEESAHKCGRNRNWKSKSQPNYFISINIDNQTVTDNLFKLTCSLLDTNKTIEKYLVPNTSYHLTLCTLRIDTDLDMQKVQAILDRVLKSEHAAKNFPITIEFKNICEFYNKVLYVRSDNTEELTRLDVLRKLILKEFEDASVNTAGNYYEFVPHLTVVKLAKNSNSFGSDTVMSLVSDEVWEGYKDFSFGGQEIKEFQLCKMTNINLCKSYPVEYTVRI